MKDAEIQGLIDKTFNKLKNTGGGKNASYIPELAKADPNLFGISFVSCNGTVYEAGKTTTGVPIESISKLFTLARAVDELGGKTVSKKIGHSGSWLPFNSAVAADLSPSHTINPFVNQGAMATTSLLYTKNKAKFKARVLGNLDRFAGKKLGFNTAVYKSESETNSKNMALAYLLKSHDRFYGDVNDTVDVYTQQCSKTVSARDLATMACVFAKGGYHPHTGKRVIAEDTAKYVIRAMHRSGLYEYSGTWAAEVGYVAAKSGVAGGVLIILNGIGGLAIISPPLDAIGNSVRGVKAGKLITKGLYNIKDAAAKFCPPPTTKQIRVKKSTNDKTRKRRYKSRKSRKTRR
jgi:glutaminase